MFVLLSFTVLVFE